MLWPDISRVGRAISDVVRGMSVIHWGWAHSYFYLAREGRVFEFFLCLTIAHTGYFLTQPIIAKD